MLILHEPVVHSEEGLKGKVALVTGAGHGIGKALVLRWASLSVRLALNDIDARALENVKQLCLANGLKESDILLLPGDVTETYNHSKWLKSTLDHFGHLDILVNNAGKMLLGFVAQTPDVMTSRLFEVNFFAPVELSRKVLPYFLERKSGQIVQIGSAFSRWHAVAMSSYVATKAAAVVSLTTLYLWIQQG
jgi:short-subunit dehydrogenase